MVENTKFQRKLMTLTGLFQSSNPFGLVVTSIVVKDYILHVNRHIYIYLFHQVTYIYIYIFISSS